MSDVPRVTFTPTESGGLALINGQQTDVIAELVLVGNKTVVAGLGLSRYDVIVACWWEAKYGDLMFQSRWDLWARYVEIELRRGELEIEDLPLPPRMLRVSDPGE